MKVVVQRVSRGSVSVGEKMISSMGLGLMILVGIEEADGDEDIKWLSNKICGLRIFDDAEGIMNLSVKDISGEIIAVSQFTLHARVKKGFRPSYIEAASPDVSIPLYETFVRQLELDLGNSIGTGVFGAHMNVDIINDGPVTIIIDSKNRK